MLSCMQYYFRPLASDPLELDIVQLPVGGNPFIEQYRLALTVCV